MGSARANVEITATASKLTSVLNEARSKMMTFASAAARGVGSAFKKLGPSKEAFAHFGGNLMTKGFDAVMDTANDVRNFERNLVRLGIAAGKTPEQLNVMRKSIRDISKDTSVADSEILAGAQTYIDLTGDVKGAENAMNAFARISIASGSSVSDVATATAALQQSMKLDPGDIEAAFSGLISQGKLGAVSLKDFAGELSALAPRFAKFGGSGVKGVADLGAAFQVVRQGFGSASEAATGMEAFMGSLTQNAAKFEAAGVKIFNRNKDGSKTLRSFGDIVTGIGNSKLMKDPTALAKAFGSKEAAQAFDMLNKNLGLYDQLYQAGLDNQAVQRDSATYLESDAGRLDKAFNAMKVAIANAFTPERIAKFTSAVEGLAEKMEPLVGMIGKAADALGGIMDIGKSIRGAMEGGVANPFEAGSGADNMFDAAQAKLRDQIALDQSQKYVLDKRGNKVLRSSKEGQALVLGAQLRKEHAEGFSSSVSNIMANEANEKTTKASINTAIAAYMSENIGSSEAGRRYLRAAGYAGAGAGVDKEKIQAIVNENMKTLGIEFAKEIKGALGGLNIEMGSDKVVDATRKSGANRTRP